jgi:hypothetical protein
MAVGRGALLSSILSLVPPDEAEIGKIAGYMCSGSHHRGKCEFAFTGVESEGSSIDGRYGERRYEEGCEENHVCEKVV